MVQKFRFLYKPKVPAEDLIGSNISSLSATIDAIVEARAKGGQNIPTFYLMGLNCSFISLGDFQDVDDEVNLEECKKLGVIITRRKGGGGGATYQDKDAAMLNFFIADKNFCSNVDEWFRFMAKIELKAWEKLGVKNVWYRHIGDVRVGEKKFSAIGYWEAKNVSWVGGVMNLGKPNSKIMSRILKPPPEKFADKKIKDVAAYVGNLEEVLGKKIDENRVKEAFLESVEEVVGSKFIEMDLTKEEKEIYEKLIKNAFVDEDWLFKRSSKKRFGKLPEGLRLGKIRIKSRKLVTAYVTVDKENIIRDIMISGDFYVKPVNAVDEIEENLKGVNGLDEEEILKRIEKIFQKKGYEFPLMEPSDFAKPIVKAVETTIYK